MSEKHLKKVRVSVPDSCSGRANTKNGEFNSPLKSTADIASEVGLSERVAQQRKQIAIKLAGKVKDKIQDTELADKATDLLQLDPLAFRFSPRDRLGCQLAGAFRSQFKFFYQPPRQGAIKDAIAEQLQPVADNLAVRWLLIRYSPDTGSAKSAAQRGKI